MSGAHGIGAAVAIQPGTEIWSTKRGHAGADAIDDDKPGDPIGGIVVRVTETADPDTGEIERAFLVVDHTRTRPHLRTRLLAESEVDPDTAQTADLATLCRLWRIAAHQIGYTANGKPRRGPALAEEARLGLIIYELLGCVFGDGGILHAALTPPTPDTAPVTRPTAPVNVSLLVD